MPADMINVVSIGIGILGIIVSIVWPWYFYLKTVKRQDPRCRYRTYKDIAKRSPEGESKIKIYYGSEEVDRVFTTYAWFWNAGKKVIKAADGRPSRLTLNFSDKSPGFRILDCHVARRTPDKTSLEALKLSDTSLAIEFDCLNHRDGAVIEIQHTGSYATKITSFGSIRDATDGVKTKPWPQEVPKRHPYEELPRPQGYGRRVPLGERVFMIAFVLYAVAFGALYLIYKFNNTASPAQSYVSAAIIFLASGWMIFRVLSKSSEAIPRSLYPTWRQVQPRSAHRDFEHLRTPDRSLKPTS